MQQNETQMRLQHPPSSKKGMPKLSIGTSGYSYTEWIGKEGFYPERTPAKEMLAIYAEHFPVTELNYTWYQMPKAPAIERMLEKVPEYFHFAAKLNRSLTHEVAIDQWKSRIAQFRAGIAPLIQSRQLIAILIQLPPYFERTQKNRLYLARLLEALFDLPLAIEFRHISWAKDSVFSELEKRRITLVSVDAPDLSPLFPKLDVVTNPDLFYIRFHGRNKKGWRSGNMQLQFDYDYSDEELLEWTQGSIEKMASKTLKGAIFFNNHVRGNAPKNAVTLREQLKTGGVI